MQIALPVSVCFAFLLLAKDGLLAQDYVTKDGKLTQQLKVVQLQGGFAGNTGVQYTIAPDGSWTSESLFNQKTTPKSKGKLSEKDLAKLGALLEKYELAKLPAKSGKLPGANQHTITFEFGDKKASLVGQMPPKLDAKNPTATVESRFAGIWQGVVGLLTPLGEEEARSAILQICTDNPKMFLISLDRIKSAPVIRKGELTKISLFTINLAAKVFSYDVGGTIVSGDFAVNDSGEWTAMITSVIRK